MYQLQIVNPRKSHPHQVGLLNFGAWELTGKERWLWPQLPLCCYTLSKISSICHAVKQLLPQCRSNLS